ncbi:MAG: class I adenylate-forming enzyme family protein [Gammaproteobacteria bacterium]
MQDGLVFEPQGFPATMPALLTRIASEFADGEAIVRGARRLTYRALEAESARLARRLLAEGHAKGARIAILLPNGPDWALAWFAAARIGAVIVPLSTLYQAPELRFILRHADVRTLIVAARYLNHDYVERLERTLPSLAAHASPDLRLPEAPHLRAIHVCGPCDRRWAGAGIERWLADDSPSTGFDDRLLRAIEAEITPADLLATIYTSGSTAEPKGVSHWHGALVRHAWHMSRVRGMLGPSDRMCNARPWFWVAGLIATFLYNLCAGACLVVPESEDGALAADLIDRERLTHFGGAAPYFKAVSNALAASASAYSVLQLTLDIAAIARTGADGIARCVSDRQERLYPARQGAIPLPRIPNSFGMTETLGTHSGEPHPFVLPEGREGASGHAVPGVERRLVDPQTGDVAAAGSPGDLYVRGYSLMAGYHGKERHEVFEADGFFRTGDVCTADADGYLTFRSRRGEMVKVSGANVAPLEVERAILGFTGVQDCAVLGTQRPEGSVALVAAVVPLPGRTVDARELIEWLGTQLSSYKVPRVVVTVAPEDIPRTGSGKVRKHLLEPLLRARLGW